MRLGQWRGPCPFRCVLTHSVVVDRPSLSTPVQNEDLSCLRWTFHRGPDAITCGVTLASRGNRCEVRVVPEWDSRGAYVEPHDGPMTALWRHAQIAKGLREAGWLLVSRSA